MFLKPYHTQLNKKLRATLNGRYQVGGQTTTNGIKDGNTFNNYGGTIGLGYQLHPLIYLHADYGGILFGGVQSLTCLDSTYN